MAANRLLWSKFFKNANLVRPFLANPRPIVMDARLQSTFKPVSTIDHPSIMSWAMIKKYYEISPILIIVSATIVAQVLWILRTAITRDDVRYSNDSKMLCESPEIDPNNVPVRKFKVYNQKYLIDPELAAALEALRPPKTEQKQ